MPRVQNVFAKLGGVATNPGMDLAWQWLGNQQGQNTKSGEWGSTK